MTIAEFDHLSSEKKRELLLQCCGSASWADKVMQSLPAEDLVDLMEISDEAWSQCNEDDFREAFTHHPKIGDIDSLKEKFANTAHWAAGEQSGVNQSSEKILLQLAEGNKKYEDKFGYIFIVCATGKSAAEMNNMLQERLHNDPEQEIRIAAEEQNKITKIRLEKLFA